MLDTAENIQETVKELHEFFSTIDSSEFEDLDFSYLDEDDEDKSDELK